MYMYAGKDSYQEGLACYRLGNAYESIGEHDTAIQVCFVSPTIINMYGNIVVYYILDVVSQTLPGALQVSQ